MRMYSTVPDQFLDGLMPRPTSHPAGQPPFEYHYHEVEEWLQIQEGSMTFFPAAMLEPGTVFVPADPEGIVISAGEALCIPRGEIHRVVVGPQGVTYKMWTPPYEGPFLKLLDEEDISLVRKNLQLPNVENCWDARSQGALTSGDQSNHDFLDSFLSADLIFRSANGTIMRKTEYIDRPPGTNIRYPSISLNLLHKTPGSLLLSTVVHTRPKDAGPRKTFLNTRLFVKEGKFWMCRVWVNYPESGSE